MMPNDNNIFQPFLVDGEAVHNRLADLVSYYSAEAVAATVLYNVPCHEHLTRHIDNLINTYSYEEVAGYLNCFKETQAA